MLLVEDDFINAMVMQQYFQDTFDFKHVNSGYEALDELKRHNYDVVIMDINLGDETMDGMKTLSCIRTELGLSNLVTFAVTGYAMEGDAQMFLSAGFDRYLSKPVNYDEIQQAILQLPISA